jgi:hypothetical protein
MNEAVVLPKEETQTPPDKQAVAARGDIKDVVVTSWEDMQRMANAFAKSALIPQHLHNKFNDVLVILQTAKELNIPPMQAINGINVIQGKPSISPELQLALIRSKIPDAFVKIEVDEAKVSVKCTMAPSKERIDESFTSTWDMNRAKAMGLENKDNYRKQPITMLKWRAVGECARTVFPHVTRGLYNTEEAVDLGLVQSDKPQLKDLINQYAKKPVELEAPAVSGVQLESIGEIK